RDGLGRLAPADQRRQCPHRRERRRGVSGRSVGDGDRLDDEYGVLAVGQARRNGGQGLLGGGDVADGRLGAREISQRAALGVVAQRRHVFLSLVHERARRRQTRRADLRGRLAGQRRRRDHQGGEQPRAAGYINGGA